MHTAYECYQCYCTLRLHFTKWDYDYFIYRGQTQTNPQAFAKRHDVPCFEALARQYKKPYDCLLAHLAQEPRKHIAKIVGDEDTYLEYLNRVHSLTYRFSQDIRQLDPDIMANFQVQPGMHPILMKAYLANKVCLETGTILLDLFDQTWEQEAQDILFKDVAIRMKKYVKFIRYNKQKMMQIVVDQFRIDDKYIIEIA